MKYVAGDETVTGTMRRRPRCETVLRVALVTPPLEHSGGIGRLMRYLVEAVDHNKVQFVIVDSRGPRQHRPLYSILPVMRATLTMVRLRLFEPPNVVHINLGIGGSTVRKCWLILVSKALGFPTVCQLHASSYPEFFGPLPRSVKSVICWSLRRCDMFLTLGTSWREFAIRDLGLASDRVRVVRCGVPGPDSRQFGGPASKTLSDPLRVLFLGRLCERKGTPQLLEALALLSTRETAWRATVAGDGDIEVAMSTAKELLIDDCVEVPGWVSAEVATKLLDDAHVLVLPSFEEGLPVSVLEAFAHGLAVVTTSVGALSEIVVDRENCLLVPVGDVTRLADALDLLARDDEFRRHIAEGGRRVWESCLSTEICVPRLIEAWEQTVGC